MVRRAHGTALVLGGVAALVALLAASAALAPSRGVPTDGDHETLVGVQGGGGLGHEFGRVGLYDDDGNAVWTVDAADSYFDVTMLEDGRVLAGFMSDGFERCGPYSAPCARTGFHVVDPGPDPRVADRYSVPVRTKTNSEVHDVERLPSGNFLHTDMEYERIVVVTPDGDTVWQWNASSYYDAPEDPTSVDWLHINDVDRVGTGRYLVSVRNENQLLVVNRSCTCVAEVINELGKPTLFEEQHNPQWIDDNAVLVADSGNDRIVELHRAPDAGYWYVAWSLRGANGIPFSWPRDADRLPNGNTLVTDSANYRVLEVDESGDVVWSMTTPNNRMPYEAERLPHGEPVGGSRYSDLNDTDAGEGRVDSRTAPKTTVPVLTVAYEALRSGLSLPFWFGQWQLLGVAGCLGTTLVGALLRWRAR